MERQKENEMASSDLIIPPIHQNFKLGGYILSNLPVKCEDVVAPFLTFTINTIAKNEKAAKSVCPIVYP